MKKIESWSDISIGQYQEIMSIQTDNEITKFVETISICFDIDPQEIRTLSLSDFRDLQSKMSFLSQDPETEVVNIIEVDGVEYGLIPDMNVITAGEFIDAEQFKLNAMDNLHNLVALIYRPITKKLPSGEYEIDLHKTQGFERRANLFKEKVSIQIVLGSVLFFSLLATELSTNFLTSLHQKMMETQTSQKTKTTRTRTKNLNKKRSTKTGGSIT